MIALKKKILRNPAWSALLIAGMFIHSRQHQKSLCVLGCVHSMCSSS